MLNLQHKIFSLNFYWEILSSILFSLIRKNKANFDFLYYLVLHSDVDLKSNPIPFGK